MFTLSNRKLQYKGCVDWSQSVGNDENTSGYMLIILVQHQMKTAVQQLCEPEERRACVLFLAVYEEFLSDHKHSDTFTIVCRATGCHNLLDALDSYTNTWALSCWVCCLHVSMGE